MSGLKSSIIFFNLLVDFFEKNPCKPVILAKTACKNTSNLLLILNKFTSSGKVFPLP